MDQTGTKGLTFSTGWCHEPVLMGITPFCPGSWHQPGLKDADEPGQMAHVARPPPWAHEPGLMPPLVPVLD